MGELAEKVILTLRKDGVFALVKKAKLHFLNEKLKKSVKSDQVFRDVLFIDGCGDNLPHSSRYRVSHQREQLAYYNISSNEVFYEHLSIDMVRLYRTFIFFRCPYKDHIEKFIYEAKKLNKTVIFDVDDLVVDTKYTDDVPYLNTIPKSERKQYDMDVVAMGKTLKASDAAITTTKRLQTELLFYVPKVLINRNVASEQMEELSEKVNEIDNNKDEKNIKVGYFSGSITHNDDFEILIPVFKKLFEKYNHLYLHIVGILDIPKELEKFKDRIKSFPFVDWKKLPELLKQVDINIAPLANNIFNEAKSENKWVEAALVKVPTIASNVGAFKECINHNKTGILCENECEWNKAFEKLIEQPNLRKEIAEQAYLYCKKHYLTYKTGYDLCRFIEDNQKKNVLFVLPSVEISGGVYVALKHASILQKSGYDVSLAYMNAKEKFLDVDGQKIPVLSQNEGMIEGCWDIAVATMWTTVEFLKKYSNIKKRYYLVQGFETEFYKPGDKFRLMANRTYAEYHECIQYVTISRWCQEWLQQQFGQKAKYIPNGIDYTMFTQNRAPRDFSGRIRILIEGDCGVHHKNIDESFRIVELLDRDKFEIWYMSYNSKPKAWYRIDRFFHKVPYSQVESIYKQCHILLKTSILESFSYPPLEMMATGGMVVAVPNNGNQEYLKNGLNCMLYKRGDVGEAVQAIERLCDDEELRHRIFVESLKTVEKRDWNKIEENILQTYIG